MKKINILVLEDKSYYDSLINIDLNKYNFLFNGLSLYNSPDDELLNYDLIINFTFNSDLVNFILFRAKNLNIATLLLADGIFEWSNAFQSSVFKNKNIKLFHPIINDYFFFVGTKKSKYFKYLGNETFNYLPKRMSPQSKKIKKSNNKCFLITTANTPYYNENEKVLLISILKEIVNQIESIGYNCIYRIFDSIILKELEIANSRNNISCTFEHCLSQVDFVITSPSSISITSMYHNRPTATVLYRDSPILFSTGWNINALTDIQTTLNSMIINDIDRINFQNFQVDSYLVENKLDFNKLVNKSNIKEFNNSQNHFTYNLLMSKYNFNFEFFIRKIFLLYKKLLKK